MAKNIIIIGIGRFGFSVAKTLCQLGHQVLAVDVDENRIKVADGYVTHTVQADTTDERALSQLGIRNFDYVIISMGDDIRSSILTTVLCKEQGAKYIVAKASDSLHAKLLYKTGADKVVQPESEAGVRLARSLVSENIIDYLELSEEYSVHEIRIPKIWVGKTLAELDVRAKYDVSVIGIRRQNEIMVALDPTEPFLAGDIIIMIGSNDGFTQICKLKS
ncbi:MAG: TrkA family potassium uptake protein [Erysipelotrichaceae bacterium]|nr:TrkA family potassium uptake protein [Erysipelotrichaceae bacterium]MDD3924888.1 TrkA family potassium uptake protein [Erysipelotrichaceae bacterium]MDD4642444.1 TrkA family potassium uptake protein [Erysipelotrichaceae bacterium]